MTKTYVIDDVYDKLDEMAEVLHVQTRFLLSYLLEEHNLGLGEDNLHLVDEFEKLGLEFIRSVSVSRTAAYITAEQAGRLGIKIHSLASFVISDNLPALEFMPDSFPGVRELVKNKNRMRGTTIVNVSRPIFEQLQQRTIDLGGDLPMAVVAGTILQSIPYQDLVEIASVEGFTKMLLSQYPKTSLRSIRIPMDMYAQLQSICTRVKGVHMWRLVTLLLHRDLDATDLEITLDRSLLPSDLKSRWKVLLGDFMEIHAAGNEN